MKKKTALSLLFVFCLGLLTGLVLMSRKPAIPPSIWVEPFLGEGSCRLPCWQNITPGLTTMGQATEILAGVGLQFVQEGDTSREQWADFKFPLLSANLFLNRIMLRSLDKQKASVATIEITPENIRLAHVIEEIGEPDGILFFSRGDTPNIFTLWSFGLVYVDQGVIVSTYDNLDLLGYMPIAPEMKVETIYFLDISNGADFEWITGCTINDLIPWKGFGRYKAP